MDSRKLHVLAVRGDSFDVLCTVVPGVSIRLVSIHLSDSSNDTKHNVDVKSPHENSDSQPMSVEVISNDRTGNEIGSSTTEDVIDSDATETIEETPPAVTEQQPFSNQTSSDKSTQKQKLKRSHFDFQNSKLFITRL
ncbi:hypothetical protein AVEN_195237-1 [Araneus ventricosus]|uniref:Uncharacterized protein n=1 Tax=Araneus ventricosus TaxID=182803 RepID=A0A4Y2WLY2_ARAVE|nr:hypothetical protein AVEN_195237-1 [Araneus ventricosus]